MFCLDLGSAYGTAKSGVGLSSMSVMRPDLMMRNVIPVVMAGILGIYGLIIGIIMNQSSMYIRFACFNIVSFSRRRSRVSAGEGLCSLSGGFDGWTFCPSCGFGNRNRRGCWSSSRGSAAQSFRRNGSNAHFWRSFGVIR